MTRSTYTRSVTTPLLSALLIGVAGATSALAQTGTVDPNITAMDINTQASKPSRADESFLKDTLQGGLAEIEAGKLAITKATHPEVTAFAQMVIDDHTKANAELIAHASQRNVKLPDRPSIIDQAMTKALSIRDKGFDEHYLKTMGINAHEKAIKRFEKFAMDGNDPDLKAFANKSLPTLQKHLQTARDLHAKLSIKVKH